MEKINKLPTISVVMPTYNSEKTLDKCLKLVRSQNYSQEKIEIIIGDGGSTDGTLEIARKYKAEVVKIPKNKQHAEYNRGVAFNRAKGEFALILDHDNFLPDRNWLKRMVKPLVDDPQIVASDTLHYHYSEKYSMMDRYFALFGVSEPLPYYLNKADRLPQTETVPSYGISRKDMGSYFLVEFGPNSREFPSIGTNGCLLRRKLVIENAKADPKHHYPIDVLVDVVRKGHGKFAIVKTSIIHLTSSQGFWQFVGRRKKFVEQYHFKESKNRRWSVVISGDEPMVILFVIYSLTLVKPFYDSLMGYLKIRDVAWFIHTPMCVATTFLYMYVTLRSIGRTFLR